MVEPGTTFHMEFAKTVELTEIFLSEKILRLLPKGIQTEKSLAMHVFTSFDGELLSNTTAYCTHGICGTRIFACFDLVWHFQ